MIEMPRRSVTRFFIPLIDVMILLFCMFLLLPIFRESDPEILEKVDKNAKRELDRLAREVADLKAKLAELQKLQRTPLQQRLVIRVLEIDPDNGRLFYYGPSRPPRRQYLDTAADAHAVIARARKELEARAKGQEVRPELHFLFVLPRVDTAFPEDRQLKTYDGWFAGVSHSIDRTGAGF